MIRKEFRKLKIPKSIWNPCGIPFEKCGHAIILSNRARGKTTNSLLFGLIGYKLFGCTMAYVRPLESDIQPKNLRNIFSFIENNLYIEKIFPDYNGVSYFGGKYTLCLRDESGKIVEKDSKPFMHLFSVQAHESYKSVFTDDKCDFIIYDEFIKGSYRQDEFVDFMDLLSTIGRLRETPRVLWLANTIDYFSPYYRELFIQKEIETMIEGDSKIVSVPEGAKVYIKLIGQMNDEKVIERNRFFFGFPNKKLQSIIGGGWAMPVYPHCKRMEKSILARNIYVNYNGNLVNLKLCYNDELGFFVDCSPANRTYNDSYIYTNGEICAANEHYLLGDGNKIDKRIWGLYENNRFFYSDNTTGAIIESFYKSA